MQGYPEPAGHPGCFCKGNLVKAFFCPVGHLTECHWPYDCRAAGCSHLSKYDLDPESVAKYQELARTAIAEGRLPPYGFDAEGNLTTDPELCRLVQAEMDAKENYEEDQSR